MTTPTTTFAWGKPIVGGSSFTWGTEANAIFDAQDTLIGAFLSAANNRFTVGGSNASVAAWTTSGVRIKCTSATYTDSSSSGTVAAVYVDAFKAATLAASSAAVYTNAYGCYFEVPVAGTNVTLTNAYALGADSAKIAGSVVVGGSLSIGNGSTLNLVGGAATTGFSTSAGAPYAFCSGSTIWSSDSGGGFYLNSTGTTASAANGFIDSSTKLVLRSTSSIRYKTDVQYLAGASEIVDALKPMTFRSLAAADDPAKRHYGLLAEEVAKVEPALVQWTKAESVTASDDYLAANAVNGMVPDGVQYERIVVLLVAEVQSLRARLKAAGIA